MNCEREPKTISDVGYLSQHHDEHEPTTQTRAWKLRSSTRARRETQDPEEEEQEQSSQESSSSQPEDEMTTKPLQYPVGEVLGQPHPDWPEDLKTFEERRVFQRGVAAARQVDGLLELKAKVAHLEVELQRLVSALNSPFQRTEELTEEWREIQQAMTKNNPYKVGG